MEETSVKFIRLSTGEDILADTLIVDETENDAPHIVMYHPLKVLYMMMTNGSDNGLPEPYNRLSLSLINWILPTLVDKQEFKVYESDILTMAVPSEDMLGHYYEYLEEGKFEKGKEKPETLPVDTDDLNILSSDDLSKTEGAILLNALIESRKKEPGTPEKGI